MPLDPTKPVSIEEAFRQIQERSTQRYSPVDASKYIGGSPVSMSRTPDTFEHFSSQEMDYMQRYDVAPDPGSDLNERLAQAQSSWDMVKKGIVRLGATTLTKTGSGIGFTAGLLNPANWGENYIAKAADNEISKFFDNVENEYIKQELAPMFQSKEDAQKGFFARAFTDLNFWTDDVVDGVAFMASTMGPGAGVRGLKLGEKIMSKVAASKYAGMADEAMKASLKGPNIATGAELIDKFATYATMTSMEAMFEADGVRKTIETDALAKFKAGEIDMAGYQDMVQQSKIAARDAFALNMAFLAPSNLFEQKMLGKLMGKNMGKVDGVTVKGTLADPQAAFTAGSRRMATAKGVGEGILAEGFYEENVQYSIEKVNTDMSPEKRGLDLVSKIGEVISSTVNVGEYDRERGMAIGLGAVIGGIGGGVSSYKQQGRDNKAGKGLAEAINKSAKAYSDPALDIYKRDADGNIEVKDGQPVIDDVKAAAFDNKITGLQEFDNVLEQMESDPRAEVIANYMKQKQLGVMASAYYQAGLYDELKEKVKEDPKTLKQVEKLEDLFKTQDQSLTSPMAQARKVKMMDIGVDILALNSMREDLVSRMKEEDSKYEPSIKAFKDLTNALKKTEVKIQSLQRLIDDKSSGAEGMFFWPHLQYEYGARGSDPLAEKVGPFKEMLAEEERNAEALKEQIKEAKESLPFDPTLELTSKQRELDLIDLAELEVAQMKRAEQWKSIVSPAGAKAYEKMLKDLEIAYFNPYGFDILNDKTTKDTYKKFEDASVSKQTYRTKRDNVERKHGSKPVEDLLNEGDLIGALRMVQTASDKLNPDVVRRLQQAAQDKIAELNEELDQGNFDIANDLQDLEDAYASAQGNLNKSTTPYEEVDEESIRIKVAENFVNGGQEVLQNVALSPEYDNVEEAKKQLSILTKLKGFIEDNRSDNWDNLKSEIDKTIQELKDIIPTLEARRLDRDAQIGRVVKQHTQELYAGLGFSTETGQPIPTTTYKAVEAAMEKEFPGMLQDILQQAAKDGYKAHYAYTILSKLASMSDTSKSPLIADIEDRIKDLEEAISALFANVPQFDAKSFFLNPTSQIYGFLENFLINTNQAVTATAEHPIKTFLRTHDLAKFKTMLERGDIVAPDFSSEDMLKFVTAFEYLAGLHQVKKGLDSYWPIIQEIESEIKAIVNNKGLTAPSEEQTMILREVMTGFMRNIDGAQPYEGWVYLTGFAGTGKTNLMARWVKQLLNLPENKVYAVSATPQASMELNASLGLTAKTDIDLLIAELKGGKSFPLIVIDEVGRIPKEKLDELANAAAEVNKKLTSAGFQHMNILALGDPNQQVASSQVGGSAMDSYAGQFRISHAENLYSVHSMTTRFRSDVPSITDFQDIFLGATVNMRDNPIKVKSSQADPLRSQEDNYGVVGIRNPEKDVITWASSQNLTDGKSRAVITSADKKGTYQQLLAAYPEIKIYSPEDVQGLTIAQVFVDITAPVDTSGYQEKENKTNYTSFSRASELLMVAGFNLENVTDPTMLAVIDDRKSKKSSRSQEFVNTREQEYKDIAGFFGLDPTGATSIINKSAPQSAPPNPNASQSAASQPTTQAAPTQQAAPQPTAQQTSAAPTATTQEEEEQDETLTPAELVPEEEEEQTPETSTDTEAGGTPNPPLIDSASSVASQPFYNVVTLDYPSGQNISSKPDIEGITPGNQVYFIKQRDRSTGNFYIRVIAEIAPGKFSEAAVLSEQEIDLRYPELRAKLNDPNFPLSPLFPDKRGIHDYQVVNPMATAVVAQADYLSYNFGPIVPFNFSQVMEVFLTGFLGRTPTKNEVTAWSSKAQVVIFSQKSLEKFRKDYPNSRFVPRLGFAYLQVSNGEQVQHIPLTRNELNIGDPNHRELVEPIVEFKQIIDQLEAITSTFGLPPNFKLGNRAFNGFISKLGQGNIGGALQHIKEVYPNDPVFANFKLPFAETSQEFQKLALLARQAYHHYEQLDYNATARAKFEYKIDPVSFQVELTPGIPVRNHREPFRNDKGKLATGEVVSNDGVNSVVKVGGKEVTVPNADLFAYFDPSQRRAGAAQRALNKIARANTLFHGVMIQTAKKQGTKDYITAKGLLASRETFGNMGKENSKVWQMRIAKTIERIEKQVSIGAAAPNAAQVYADLVKGNNYSNLIGRIDSKDLTAMIQPNTSSVRTYAPIRIRTEGADGKLVSSFEYMGEDKLNNSMNDPTLSSMVSMNLASVSPSTISITSYSAGANTSTPTPPATPPSGGTARKGTFKGKFGLPVTKAKAAGQQFTEFWGSKKAMKYLKSVFPDMTEEQLQMIDEATMLRVTGGKRAWGYFLDGVIAIEEDERGFNAKVLKHEAFHKIWRERLTVAERTKLQKRYELETGRKLSVEAFEEEMADVYMDWKKGSKIPYFLVRVFKAIAKFFGFTYRNFDTIDEFFTKMEAGVFSEMTDLVIEGGAPKLKIEEIFGTVEVFIQARNLLKGMIKSLYIDDVFTREDIYKHIDIVVSDYYDSAVESYAAKGITMSEVEQKAFEILQQPAENGKASPMHLLWKEHYGKVTFHGDSESGESADDSLDETEEAEKETANLSEHILSADSYDRFKKVLASAKDFLSTIKLDNNKFLPEKAAFVALAKRLYNLDLNNPENYLKDLKHALSSQNPAVKAVGETLMKIARQALDDVVIIEEQVDGKVVQVTVDLLTAGVKSSYGDSSVEEPNMFEIAGKKYLRRSSDITNPDFMERVSQESGVPYSTLKAAYLKTRANNMLSTLNNAAGSLETRVVMQGTKGDPQYIKVGEDTVVTSANQYNDVAKESNRSALRADVLNAIAQNRDKVTSWEFPTTNVSDPEKGRIIKRMFQTIGLSQTAETIYGSPDELNTWLASMKFIKDAVVAYRATTAKDITKLSREERKQYTTKEENSDKQDVTERYLTLEEFLSTDRRGDLKILFEALSTQMYDYETTSSYKTADGKTKWLMSLTSQAAEVFAYINTPRGRKGLAPAFAENSFMLMNPILAKQVRIGEMVYHLEIDKGYGKPLMYKNEGFLEVLERMAFYAFMPNRFKASTVPMSGDSLTYYQFTQINSNKPETRAVEMTVKGAGEIRDLLEKLLRQESFRPDNIGNLKNYTPGISNFPALVDGKIVDRPVLPKDASPEQVNDRIKEVLDLLDNQASKLASIAVSSNMLLPADFYETLNKMAKKGLIPEPSAELAKTFVERNRRGEKYGITEQELKDYFKVFSQNHYVNGYMLNQLTTGDQSFFKDSYDIIKRMSVAWATGYRGRVSEEYGLPVSYKSLILEDVERDFFDNTLFAGKTKEEVSSAFLRATGEKVNYTDAQGFITEKFAQKMRMGFGREMQLGNVMKPVHFEVDGNGIPRAIKYSAIVLTEALIKEFPELGKLAKRMEDEGIDQAVFESAVKVGLPRERINNWNDVMSTVPLKSPIVLRSSNLRIQLNPRHSLDGHVTQPSQLLYFLTSDPNNFHKALDIYNSIARVQKLGQLQVNEWLGLRQTEARKQKKRAEGINPYHFTQKKIKTIVSRNATESSQSTQQEEILKNKNISLNFPLIADQAQLMFNSWMSKSTVELKYSGTKMVLQSSVGTANEEGLRTPRLVIDDDGKYVMECYIPEGFGKSIGLKEKDMFIGFRIPSTELHSGVPLKVIGFLKNSDNVIIVPPQITWLHGSDFDVDALFTIHREAASKDLVDINGKVIISKGTLLEASHIDTLEALYKEYRDILNDPGVDQPTKVKIREVLYGTTSDNKGSLLSLLKEAIKNKVSVDFLDIFRDEKNLENMMTPITMEYLKGDNKKEGRENAQASLFDLIRDARGLSKNDELFKKRDINLVTDYIMMHQDNFSGAKATGIFANGTKGYNYLFAATGDPTKNPQLSKSVQFTVDGVTFDSLSKTEKELKDGQVVDRMIKTATGELVPAKVGERFDSLVNAAIDNVKEQILSIINVSNTTLQSWMGLLATGLPLETTGMLMLQPAIVYASKQKGSGSKTFKLAKENILAKLETFYTDIVDQKERGEIIVSEMSAINLGFADLKQSITKDMDVQDPLAGITTKEELLYQLAALNLVMKGAEIGNHIGIYSSIANLAKSIPTFTHDQAAALDLFTKLYATTNEEVFSIQGLGAVRSKATLVRKNGKYVPKLNQAGNDTRTITGVDILGNVPHIEQAYLQLKQLYANNSDLFDKTNKYLIGIAGLIKSNYLPKLTTGSIHKTKEFIVKEYLNYMLSGINITDKNGKTLINLDDSAEPQIDLEGDAFMEGSKAWAYRLTQYIEEIKAGNQSEESKQKYGVITQTRENNTFLANLVVSGTQPETKQLRFFKTANLEQEEVALFRKDFMKLVGPDGKFSALQYDLVKYLIVTQGLRYGASNYGPVVDPNMYIAVDKAITENITNKLYKLNAASSEERSQDLTRFANSIKEFTLQLAINNADSIMNVSSKSIVKTPEGSRRGVDELTDTGGNKTRVYYDLKLNIPETQKSIQEEMDYLEEDNASESDEEQIEGQKRAKTFGPEYLAYWGAIFKKVNPPSGYSSGYWYYQEVGKQGKIKNYKMNTGIFEKGFDTEAVFNPSIPVRVNKRVEPNNSKMLAYDDSKSSAPEYPIGSIIGLRRAQDLSRTNVYLYRVMPGSGQKKYTLLFEGKASSIPSVSMVEQVKAAEDEPTADDTLEQGFHELTESGDLNTTTENC